jgi:hypothetical protein
MDNDIDSPTPDVDAVPSGHCMEHGEVILTLRFLRRSQQEIKDMQSEMRQAIIGDISGHQDGFHARLERIETWRKRVLWFGVVTLLAVMPIVIGAGTAFAWKLFAHIEGIAQQQQTNTGEILQMKNQPPLPGPAVPAGPTGAKGLR